MRTSYTDEFWARAIELTMQRVKRCEKCLVHDGENISRTDRPKRKTVAVVRVALRKPKVLTPENLGLFCTKCRRGEYEVKAKPEQIAKLVLPLFP